MNDWREHGTENKRKYYEQLYTKLVPTSEHCRVWTFPLVVGNLVLTSVLNVKAVVAAFNQEKALAGAISVIMNLRMDLFEALLHNSA